MQELSCTVGVFLDAERENDFTLLAVAQFEWKLDRRAGIQGSPHLSRKPRPCHRGGVGKGAVAPEEFGAVAAEGSGCVVHVEEGGPSGKVYVVWISREQGAAVRINIGDDVHGCFRPQIAQHPFHVPGGRESTRSAGCIAHLQHGEFDGCV
jgi:hypothetical protein